MMPEAGGLPGDYGDVAGTGDGVGHAGVEAAAEKRQMSAGWLRVAGRRRERDFRLASRNYCGGEDAEGGDVEIDVGVRKGTPAGGGSDDDDVFAGGGWRSGG